jgi:probable HAF family extracellular repeat protein
VKTLLPTLGGNNAAAVAINNRGQATGVAETNVVDPVCASPQVFDFKAVIWGPKEDEIHELSPLPGDNEAVTTGINDNGRVVGTSANCAFGPFPIHAVLWQDGKPINLGTLGGAVFNIAFGINNRGQVVGGSDLPGDIGHQAFLWENGVMTDLGSLPGLPVSQALSINNQGQVVGFSQDLLGVTIVAWIWENGLITDLNSLIPADSPWFLVEALGINDRAQIAGFAFNTSTRELRGFILTPVQSSESNAQTARSTVSKEPPVLPEEVRQMLKRRTGARLHWPFPPN